MRSPPSQAAGRALLGHVIAELAFQPAPALLDTLDVLLLLGATPGPDEDPPIVAAVRASAPPAVFRVLLARGADPDQRRADGMPALVLAARLGDHAAVDLLVQAGADVDAIDPRGRTALMYAVERNHRAVAAVLLLGGADLEPGRAGRDDRVAAGAGVALAEHPVRAR